MSNRWNESYTAMVKFSGLFEKWVSVILLIFAMLVITYQVLQLIYTTIEVFSSRIQEYGLVYEPDYARNVAILFFNILLMLEIMQTLKTFSYGHVIKARVIMIVCLIAASRKVLALGESVSEPLVELSLGGLILSLSVGYFLVSRIPTNGTDKNTD